jgi:SAM-dependent methyltransferase
MAPKTQFGKPSVHYKVRGAIVRSENAAKPAAQAAKAVRDWLRRQPMVGDALDFGCGKLRYAAYIAARAKRVTFVDSAIQIMRPQRLLGRRTTVCDSVKRRWPASRVLDAAAFRKDWRRYDLALCANVLSAVPSRRMRLNILRTICQRLRPHGLCLLVSQYRNSDFVAAASRPGAQWYQDGWILKGRRGVSFYAPLGAERLRDMARRAGLSVREICLHDGTALVAVTPNLGQPNSPDAGDGEKRAAPDPRR